MNHYVITRQHIDALRAMLAGGIGRTGKPFSVTRRKQMEKQIEKLESECNEKEN